MLPTKTGTEVSVVCVCVWFMILYDVVFYTVAVLILGQQMNAFLIQSFF